VGTFDGSEELETVGKTLPDLISTPHLSGLEVHSNHTHLDSFIAAPSSENDVILRGAGRALASRG